MNDKNEIKRLVLLLTIGLCDAIRGEAISIDEARYLLFSPHSMRLLKWDGDLKHIIHLGTEFDSLKRLAPQALNQAIDDLKIRAELVLAKTPPCENQGAPWLDRLVM